MNVVSLAQLALSVSLHRGCTWSASIPSTPGTPMETTWICAMTKTCACCPGSRSSSECLHLPQNAPHCSVILLTAVTWSYVFCPLNSKFDLYTKTTEMPDVEELKPYYQSLIDKYCPGILKWWKRRGRNVLLPDISWFRLWSRLSNSDDVMLLYCLIKRFSAPCTLITRCFYHNSSDCLMHSDHS